MKPDVQLFEMPSAVKQYQIMQNMRYGLFSMQHGSFELSDSRTHVLHNEEAAFTHCILSK